MLRTVFIGILSLTASVLAVAAPLQVSALHPLMADLARQVGGDRVQVFDLVGEGGNPHRFEPRPADMEKLQASTLILAAGKNQEAYLGRIRDSIKQATLVEVGHTIPSLTVGKDAVYACCPDHETGAEADHKHAAEPGPDPHWWHGVENMRRAARVVAQAMAVADPANKETYLANATAYGQRLDQLKRWAAMELSKVPRAQRKLVTSHNAFAYFAKEFGFEVIAVAGLNNEQNNTPQELAKTITAVKEANVKAIFPEQKSNPKVLESISAATGAAIATALIADGNGSGPEAGFEAMIRHNVTAISKALATP